MDLKKILEIFSHTNSISHTMIRGRANGVVKALEEFETLPFVEIKHLDKINLYLKDFYYIQQNLFECYNYFKSDKIYEMFKLNKLNIRVEDLTPLASQYVIVIEMIRKLDTMFDDLSYYLGLRDTDQIQLLINGTRNDDKVKSKLIFSCCSLLLDEKYRENEDKKRHHETLEKMFLNAYGFDKVFSNFVRMKTAVEGALRTPIIIESNDENSWIDRNGEIVKENSYDN